MAVNRAYEHDHLDNAITTRRFIVKQPHSSKDVVRLILKENNMCVNMSHEDARDLISALAQTASNVERHVNSENEEC